MKLYTLLLISLMSLNACVSYNEDMTGYVIDEYSQVDKSCNSDTQCKVLEVGYIDCANHRYMVYSSKFIKGSNEERLKVLANDYTKNEAEILNVKNCALMSGAPSKGVCYKGGCEQIKTWR